MKASLKNVPMGVIHPNLYGHFSEHLGRCIYGGVWVGRDSPIPNTDGLRQDVIQALRRLRVPVLRWPGGCFAEEYHWQDGVGQPHERSPVINASWGNGTEDNSFGTHEFMRLCELIGAEPYLCGNVSSGTVREMAQWVEYITYPGDSAMARLRRRNGREEPWDMAYFGIGNENWGCGGSMRPEFYIDEYRKYATHIRNYGKRPLYKVACGNDTRWTELLMQHIGQRMDGMSVHYYVVPNGWEHKGASLVFDQEGWVRTMRDALYTRDFLRGHCTIMDKYDPQKKIGLVMDEWGTWFDAEPGTNPAFLFQQNTLRDALVAGVSLNIFHDFSDRLVMANLAQLVNVLQAPLFTQGERLLFTPTYHVLEMYKHHQGAQRLELCLAQEKIDVYGMEIDRISASASQDAQGGVLLTLCNLHPAQDILLTLELSGFPALSVLDAQVLTHAKLNAHNTFEQPDRLRPKPLCGASLTAARLTLPLPHASVCAVRLG